MQSWPIPSLASLPGTGPAPRLYDTASRQVAETVPAEGPATLYVCGITPYDATHLGHAATYLTFDLIVRLWRDAGYRTAYTQNVTDVDDPLLERAEQTGEDWVELALRETQLFREDMTALRMLPPDSYVGAVESIPQIAALVERLRSEGAVYDVDGDLYFAVKTDPDFGSVSGYDAETMRALFAERGGDPDREGKRDPLDCLLWQAERPGEPAWDSPFGRGRPGWHVECAAIALNRLGQQIDVNGGGSDLIFPHHECGAAHAEAFTGVAPFARHYTHAGMIGLDGEKMSKSRGNLVFVSKLRSQGVDPNAIRLALLAGHYRTDRAWTADLLDVAQARLARWRDATARNAAAPADGLLARLRDHLTDDLDTPSALAAVDEWAAADGGDRGAPGLAREAVDALLGVRLAG